MVFYVTKVSNFRSGLFRIYSLKNVIENKRFLYGSWIRKLTPPPITPTPLALRRWGGFALARPTSLPRLTAGGNGVRPDGSLRLR